MKIPSSRTRPSLKWVTTTHDAWSRFRSVTRQAGSKGWIMYRFQQKIMFAAGICCLYGVYQCISQGPMRENVLLAGAGAAVALLASLLAPK